MIYKCRCHVCGNEFDHEASFMSCGSYADGKARISCNVEPSTGVKHTREEIREAWLGLNMPRVPGNGLAY